MSWLSRAINSVTFSVIFFGHVAVSRIFLFPFESICECLLLQCLCLYCLSEFFECLFFVCRVKWVVLNAAPRNGHVADVTCPWTAFAFQFKLFSHCRHFIHRFARVTLRACLRSAANRALMQKMFFFKSQAWVQVQICRLPSVEKCPYRPQSPTYRLDQDIPSI